ncbi:hypothetical protein VSR82_33005 [Burkholderia sp. JPY481]
MGTHSIYIGINAVLMTAFAKDSNEAVSGDIPNAGDKQFGTV